MDKNSQPTRTKASKTSKTEATILFNLLDTHNVICLDCRYCKRTQSNNSKICRECLEAGCRARKLELKDSVIEMGKSILKDFYEKTGKQ